ncbi:RpiB/LacA/LacB family sugar-phosphate isomerase [Trueperella pyogenes]|uniref:RpiB/LacA/LacB family sugar-phosphate isomerase n=1 Tax=Trueperella pyogenes TaxID=1661 RepID=UPI003DA8897C
MKLAFGCDPNATALKHDLMKKAAELGHEVADLGSDDPIYANVAFDVATAVAKGEYDRGVLVCGTGIGVSIAANKVEGAYCACIHDVYQSRACRLVQQREPDRDGFAGDRQQAR